MRFGLELAVEHCRNNKQEQALDALLECWRETRDPAVANCIEALSIQLDPGPLIGRTRHKRRLEWNEIVEELAEADVPRLLAAIPSFACKEATELLQEVGTWLPDPRIFASMLTLLADPPSGFRGQVQRPFWHEVMTLLTTSADPREFDALSTLRNKYRNELASGNRLYSVRSLPEFLAGELTVLLERAHQPIALHAEDEPALRLLQKMLRPGEDIAERQRASADLLLDVYSNPGDDGARLVMGDVLQELEDPRGEFIALQMAIAGGDSLSQTGRRRMKDLFLSYGRQWLGEIEPCVMKSGLKYRRGFPAVAKVYDYDYEDPGMLHYPQWSTFEELDVTSWKTSDPLELLQQPQLRALRKVSGALPSVFSHSQALPFETLGLRRVNSFSEIARSDVLPKLRHLDVSEATAENAPPWAPPFCRTPVRLRGLWEPGALGHQLSKLTVISLGDWIPEWLSEEPPIKTIEVKQERNGGWGGTLSRDSDGPRVLFSYRKTQNVGVTPFQELRRTLRNVRLDGVQRVSLELGPGVQWNTRRSKDYTRLFAEHGIPNIELPQP